MEISFRSPSVTPAHSRDSVLLLTNDVRVVGASLKVGVAHAVVALANLLARAAREGRDGSGRNEEGCGGEHYGEVGRGGKSGKRGKRVWASYGLLKEREWVDSSVDGWRVQLGMKGDKQSATVTPRENREG